ncbi:hypothetical protein ACFE04_024088 [Oxalis oulophora]
MEEVPGSLGTSAGLALRMGQTIFSSASLLFMCLYVQFYSFTAFSYLVTVMGLLIPWSVMLALVDAYSVFVKSLPRHPRIVVIIIFGDLALSFLTLAAACSTASVTDILLGVQGYCEGRSCSRFQLSAAMAFLAWFLSFATSMFNLWVLPSLL